LEKLAQSINSQAYSELDRALQELNKLSEKESLERLPDWNGKKRAVFLRRSKDHYFEGKEKSYIDALSARYPWFQFAFWLDGNGSQRFKIAAGSMTPPVDVKEKDYFKQIACGEPNKPDACDGLETRAGFKFRMYPLDSPNTGEFAALVGSPYGDAKTDAAEFKGKEWDLQAKYVANKFESLVNPVVPPGYGYAVLNSNGAVQFHSVAHRNLIEDFPRETGSETELRARLAQGSSGFLATRYQGQEQLLYMTPLKPFRHPPLTLVVFRSSKHYTASTEGVHERVAALILGYIALLWLAAVVYLWLHREYPLAAIWPEPDRQGAYLNLALTTAYLALAFLLRYRSMTSLGALFAAFGLGVIAAVYPVVELGSRKTLHKAAMRVLVLVYLVILAGSSWHLLFAFSYAVYLLISWSRSSRSPETLTSMTISLKYSYTGFAASLLFAVVMAPCCGIFKYFYDVVEMEALQADQIDLARSLHLRSDRIHEYYRRIKAPTLTDVRLAEILDRHDFAFFNTLPSIATPLQKNETVEGSNFRAFVNNSCSLLFLNPCSRLFPLDPLQSAEFRWQIVPASADKADTARANNSAILLMRNASDGSPVVASDVPSWPGFGLGGGLFLIVATIVLITWIYYMTDRLFFIDWNRLPPWPEVDVVAVQEIMNSTATYKHMMIIGHPKSGKSTFAKDAKIGHTIDIAEIASTGDWQAKVPQTYKIIILDHFEFGMDSAELNLKKLELLENLIYVHHCNVVILSAVNLMFYLACECPDIVWTDPEDMPRAIQVLDRWANVLSLFRRAQFKDESIVKFNDHLDAAERQSVAAKILVGLVRSECDHTAMLRRIGADLLATKLAWQKLRAEENDLEGLVVEYVLDRADSYYRALWATCTKDERLVLFQLSKDGWLNPKNERAIRDLERRNLIVRHHGFRVMNKSFRQFVLDNQYPEEIADWEEDAKRSAWRGVRRALVVAGLAIGVWLVYSQQATATTAIGYISVITTGAATVSGLLSAVRGRNSGNTPPGAQAT
jgi:hypothetical protein